MVLAAAAVRVPTVEKDWYALPILRTDDIQQQLSPRVSKVSWTDAGGGVAIVLVEGDNFFSGTEVTIGGARYRAGDGNLILKSQRAMEIRTTIAALAKGDAVLSGRYGGSKPLIATFVGHDVPADGVNIVGVSYRNDTLAKFSWMEVTLSSASDDRLPRTVFDHTPTPIVCVDDVVVPQPYYFNDGVADQDGNVVVGFFVPTDALVGAKSVLFKAPFMGANWAPTTSLPEDRVTVAAISAGVMIFTGTLPFLQTEGGEQWRAVLDQEYRLG